MPPKASSVPPWRRTRSTARKSIVEAKSTARKSSPPPSPSTAVTDSPVRIAPPQKDNQLSPEQSLSSQVPEANTEETGVKLSSPENHDEAEQGTPAKTMEIEAVGEQKLGQSGKKKVVKKTIKVVKKIVKKKVPKSVAKNFGKTEESEKGRETAETETVLDSFDVEKASSPGTIEPETEYLEPSSAATAGDSDKGNSQPVVVEKGTIAAEVMLGKDGMKDCEVSVTKDKLELPISECNDAKDNIGSPETGNVVLDSEKGNLRSVKIVKKIVKKKVPKSVAKNSGKTEESEKGRETAETETVLDSFDVEKASSPGTIEPETEYLEPSSAATAGDSDKGNSQPVVVEKVTIAAEVMLGKDGMKDCEVSVTKDKLELPISECNDAKDNIGSPETGNVVLDPEKGNLRSVKIVKKIVKKKVPKLVSKNSGRTEESQEGRESTVTETVLDSFDVEKASSRRTIEPETEYLEPSSAATAGESEKGNFQPIVVDKGTIAAEGILGKDGMKDCEVSVTEDKLELPISECKDTKDNIGSLETGNIVLDSEKGNLRPVKIVKKIVKKKVAKLVARKSGKKEEVVKGSKNGDTETILDSAGVEKCKPSPPETENLESCKAVSAKNKESKNHSLHPMEVEKATSVSEFDATENTLEPSILECKDSNVVENDNMDSLEIQTVVLDSKKGSLDVSTSDNVDSNKDQNLGQLGEEGYSQDKEETKEAVDTSLRVNEGILLSGEMEALERKKRRRTEIFIGGLDKESKEEDIRRIFGEVGEVVEVRLMINRETGKNKGFAFLRYASAADAKKAVEKYSKVEISGKQCGVSLVEGNDTIYLGNIDKKWKTKDVIDLLKKAGIENIDKVTVMANPNNIEQNRGFAFVELETSKEAQIAFSKLQKKDAFGKHMKVKVAWAQPLIEPNEEEMLKVKSVYAEYLPSSWNEEKVRDYFGKFGEIESIVLAKDLPSSRRKDFAFVNYISRESALACIEAFSHEPANDSGSKVNMKVSLAKPMPKSKQTKRVTLPTRREPHKEKKIQDQSILKRHEPNKKVNYMRRYDEGHRVDGGSSTTNELLHLLRQQGPARQLHSSLNMGSGINQQYSLSGSKRPFSAVVDNPHRMDSSGVSRVRLESSFPTANQSMLSHSRGPLGTPSFAYYSQLGSGPSPGSVYGVESFPNSFQSHDRGPYGGYRTIHRRY